VLVKQRAMEAFDNAVGLWPLHTGLAVLDALELQEQFVGMAVGPAAELSTVVAERGLDGHAVRTAAREAADRYRLAIEREPVHRVSLNEGREP